MMGKETSAKREETKREQKPEMTKTQDKEESGEV